MIYNLSEGVTVEVSGESSFLFSQRPLRVVKLNEPLTRLLRNGKNGRIEPRSEGELQVLEKLFNKGFLTRRYQPEGSPDAQLSVSIIIPVKDRAEELQRCLASLQKISYPAHLIEVIVVDDGSVDDSSLVAKRYAATVIPSGATGGGPAYARNKGAAGANGDILAFIDSDCTASKDWLTELLPAFNDEKLAAVGGWVDGLYSRSGLDKYEAVMSSLNLGKRDLSGGPGGDTFYLPSCNLLMRKSAFIAAGGFRSEMHVGEDVDLTWRLRDGGWKIQYLAAGTVYHAHRNALRSFMKRRFEYGTSEGILQQLHPGRGKKMALPPLLTLILLALAAASIFKSYGLVILALAMIIGDSFLLKNKMSRLGLRIPVRKVLAARIRAVGSLAYYTGYHLLRYFLLLLFSATLFYPPLVFLLVWLMVGVGLVDFHVKKPEMSFFSFLAIYLLEQAAYGSGVFWGCIQSKSFASYRLELSRAQF